ncbi:MAG TPA: triphosphoribosyl-dephospho-CoA synthase, partial [Mitsuokella multacida]|nr:triphosphoribosyl-dephospho-CoA synthase [Mitsuokella multacida]
ALRSSFETFARIGAERATEPVENLLPFLQEAGIVAEQRMFAATHGVNTHKGMIFSLGLLA